MSDMLTTQLRLQTSIARAVDNLKKLGRNNYTPAKLRSRIETLQSYWTQFQEGHDELTKSIPAETQSSMDYYRKAFYEITEDMFYAALDYMADALDDLAPRGDARSATGQEEDRLQPSAVSRAQLPSIKLPPFDGKYEEWETFRDRFTSLVTNNKELSTFARMHYLASCLSGRALDCIRDLPVTAENFEIAWRALVTRFENPRRLVHVHMSTLLNLSIIPRESANDLQALRDKVSLAVSSLKKLKRTPENLWDDILVHIVSSKLDPVTKKAWTIKTNETVDLPSFSDLENFISSRVGALEELSGSTVTAAPKNIVASKVHIATASADPSPSCPLCHSRHYINMCPLFVSKDPQQRREIVRSHKRCFNCLSQRHTASECSSKYSCRVCQKKHHTTLHVNQESNPGSAEITRVPCSSPQAVNSQSVVHSLSTASASRPRNHVLLATAMVTVRTSSGQSACVRALIDQGSELTLVTENLAQLLRAPRSRMPTSVSVLGGINVGTIWAATHISISPSSSSSPSFSTTALILPSLTSYSPRYQYDLNTFDHLRNISWADPDPTGAEPVNIIIGADLYNDILLDGVRKGKQGQPVAQLSIFGWIISGRLNSSDRESNSLSCNLIADHSEPSFRSVHHCFESASLEADIQRFWEIEEIPSHSLQTPLEAQCEEHFRATHSRDASGRYIVRLPFRHGPPIDIGKSRSTAEKLIVSLSRRFRCNSELEQEYRCFLREYEELGHMQPAPTSPQLSGQVTFIPHHPVLREGSSTSHLRVVFNASSATSNGSSLNDHLLAGPKLQSDISAVILNWRRWKFVYTADIAKMYRQIQVDTRDIDFQRILWYPPHSDKLSDYQLLTVTYGMSCAPFLALRVINQLIEDEGKGFPLAAKVLQDNIYVDDVLFGADDAKQLRAIRDQLIALLKRGGFHLRKWTGNSADLLFDIDISDFGLACDKSLATDERVKILGLGWSPSSDVFRYQVSLSESPIETKRSVLSSIAKLYDPSGWVTPVTITAKIFMQQLWREKLGWDDPLQQHLSSKWVKMYSQLRHLNGLQIPRWTGLTSNPHSVELHGFADASNVAYAAVVYLKTISDTGEVTISLLTGKSKVAPLAPLSVPRLELSAAVLLARLIEFVLNTLTFSPIAVYCWSDSTVVLWWLRQHPSQWKTFVANRVGNILSRIPMAQWSHVPTSENPADCASRGILRNELLGHALWWHGPTWLKLSSVHWPKNALLPPPEADCEAKATTHQCSVSPPTWDLSSRFSSWPKLLRVTGYVLKFIRCCRRSKCDLHSNVAGLVLSAEDCRKAKVFWLKHIQSCIFPQEIAALSQSRSIPSRSPILSFRPFLDRDGIVRVGGRLKNAPVNFLVRHPVILASHPLIVRQAHSRALHAGLQLTMSILRRDFWIIRGRAIVRAVIHQCVTCTRERAAIPEQIMGDLPAMRVTPSARCFQHCGVDYAGPVQVRSSPGRGIQSRKAYIALFVCLATRAIHLELVGDYSTSAFLNAFSRFCARRGLPQAMYSDNGTTFTADRELTKAYRASIRDRDFQNSTASDNIAWNFIPPSAPHFGGIWEAGVRSVKHHLRRVLGSHTLTFEEFYTLLCRIEACLNSRPIAPLRDTLDDYECLTPGHFLVGSALTVNPEPTLLDVSENHLTRWQLLRDITERFWKLWHNDYVNTLQQRVKWKSVKPPLSTGQLGLLRNPSLPPCKWELGRITRCHPGSDGLTRVVTIKTAAAEYKRPIVKLCVLPVHCESPCK